MPDEVKLRGGTLLKTLALLVVVLAVVIALLEGGSRLLLSWQDNAVVGGGDAPIKTHDLSDLDAAFCMAPHVWWSLRPNLDAFRVEGRCWDRDVAFTFSTNSAGFRGKALRPEGKRVRVLALGDSITFGLGVEDDETWPEQLETSLNAGRDVAQYEVINTGVPGYTSFQGMRLLDKRGFGFGPAVVVACFGQNDCDSWEVRTDIEKAIDEEQAAKEKEQSTSDFFLLARRAVRQANRASAKEGEKKQRLTPGDFRSTLIQMRELCDEHGVHLIFVLWPQEWQVLEGNRERDHYEPLLVEVAHATGTLLVDLCDVFSGETEPLYADPVHGNAAGCRVAAIAIAEAVGRVLGDVQDSSTSQQETPSV